MWRLRSGKADERIPGQAWPPIAARGLFSGMAREREAAGPRRAGVLAAPLPSVDRAGENPRVAARARRHVCFVASSHPHVRA